MDLDQAFRVVITVGVLLVLPIGLYYRFKSQATGEPLDRRQEGLFILLMLRPAASSPFWQSERGRWTLPR